MLRSRRAAGEPQSGRPTYCLQLALRRLLPTGSAECAMFRGRWQSPSFVVAAVDSEVSRGGMRRRPETQFGIG